MILAAGAVGIFAADVERALVDQRVAEGDPLTWRRVVSSAISESPTPSMRVWVPAKNFAVKSAFRPTASKICAPQ